MIIVKNLKKIYQTHLRQKNFLKDIFFRKYKETVAIENISFTINQGEFVGFIGPNGAGKTTTLKILAGILFPTSGNINVLGFFPFDKKREFLRQITFIMGQRNQLIWDLPAIDSFLLNKAIYEIDDHHFKKNLSLLTELLNCSSLINKPVKSLSLGERMKMELTAAFLHDPQVIFLDEPTIGLDIFSQEAIREFLKTYQKEFKKTIILTSHYLEDVKKLAKRLIIINQGRIIYDGWLKKIIDLYSKTKRVRLTLESKPPDKILHRYSISLYHYPQLIIKVDKNEVVEKLNQIVKDFRYSDITIEDESIERIIGKILNKEKLDSNK